MKKAGILTFHCTDNPGSVLQAYALQETVRSMGMDCDIINYQKKGWKTCLYHGFGRSLSQKTHMPLCITKQAAKLFMAMSYRKFNAFRKQSLSVVPQKPISDRNKLAAVAEGYDKLIAGSDQIWNFDNNKVDRSYFLDFCKDDSKKITYAASFGKAVLDGETVEKIVGPLKHIPALSVRESNGADLLKQLLGTEPFIALDPSLLLQKSDWEKIAKLPKEQGYILVYTREKKASALDSFAKRLQEEKGGKIVKLTPYRSDLRIGKTVVCPGPREWLGYFLNAGYVVTNSFHGLAFSINFQKQFYAVPLAVTDEHSTNSRIFSVLEQFGLSSAIVTGGGYRVSEIDYGPVAAKLEQKRSESKSFLREALQ